MSEAILDRFALAQPVCCAVCRRRAGETGYGLLDAAGEVRIVRCCYDMTCCRTVRMVATMSDKQFDAYEEKALADAGNEAGAYLDRLGRTDLATLTPAQWTGFLKRVLGGFEDSMRRQMLDHEAPF